MTAAINQNRWNHTLLLTAAAIFCLNESLNDGFAEDFIPKSSDCSAMEVWDVTQQMCMPLPMPGMRMSMLMLNGYEFGTRVWEQGPRGRDADVGSGMAMADIGTSLGDHHYLNLDLMLTADKWTFPDRGYPLIGQIGESDAQGVPFVDAQHPHSSPVMGLTLSDTFKIDTGPKDHFNFFFAPRGESTDGPIPFMHRPTGVVNPDAPLGHHIGQDVGHISSTVIGTSLQIGEMHYEISTFHGAEPEPESVNLPLGTPNSVALRLIREFPEKLTLMVSFAYVSHPESDQPNISYQLRYSASLYEQFKLGCDWSVYDAFILGAITHYDGSPSLYSFGKEILLASEKNSVFMRSEILQRTPQELNIAAGTPNTLTDGPRWIGATTLGYTRTFARIRKEDSTDSLGLGVGASVTKTFMPGDFVGPYGGDPWSGKLFLRFGGMKMWDL